MNQKNSDPHGLLFYLQYDCDGAPLVLFTAERIKPSGDYQWNKPDDRSVTLDWDIGSMPFLTCSQVWYVTDLLWITAQNSFWYDTENGEYTNKYPFIY